MTASPTGSAGRVGADGPGSFRTLQRARLTGATPDRIVELVEAAGLRGRGGAWFPTSRKWRSALEHEHPQGPVVVGNGGEDEPGSLKDRFLLTHHPELVVEGLLLAAFATGATEAFLYVNRLFVDALAAAEKALAAADELGLLAPVGVEIVPAPPEYVAGEETAVLEVLEGRPPLPRERPPYPSASGYQGRPTIVNNVETLANIPGIVLHGPDWYRSVGSETAPGTMWFSVEGDVPRPGLYELPLGTPLPGLLADCAGARSDLSDIGAVQAGGASSRYFTAGECRELRLDPDEMKARVSTLGAGVIRVLGPGRCMLDEALRLAAFFERECCGQCPACRMETTSVRGLLGQIAAGKARPDVFDRVGELFDFAADQGRCGFIRMPQAPFRSVFEGFSEDFAAHLAGLPCPARGRGTGLNGGLGQGHD